MSCNDSYSLYLEPLSMTLHGDMDISIIDELPKNRIPIITKIVNEDRLESIYEFIKKEINKKTMLYSISNY